jgi:hypothetical protein
MIAQRHIHWRSATVVSWSATFPAVANTFFGVQLTPTTVLSKATPTCLIYYFTRVSRVEERTIELTSDVASYSSIPSSSELSSREWSRSFRVVIGGRVTWRVGVGIRRVERIVIGLSR